MALVAKNLPTNAGGIRDLGSISGLGRYARGGHDNPLPGESHGQRRPVGSLGLKVHRVAKSWTRLK